MQVEKIFNIDYMRKVSSIVDRIYVKELVHEIESSVKVEGEDWIEKTINSISPSAHCGFSEFETYGTFVLNRHPNVYVERELPSLRYGGFIRGRFIDRKILSQMTLDVSVVSFEAYHIPPFPWSLLVTWQVKYRRQKEIIINRYIDFFRKKK